MKKDKKVSRTTYMLPSPPASQIAAEIYANAKTEEEKKACVDFIIALGNSYRLNMKVEEEEKDKITTRSDMEILLYSFLPFFIICIVVTGYAYIFGV